MTKRFELRLCSNGTYYVYENGALTGVDFDKFNKESADALIDKVNDLYNENEKLKIFLRAVNEELDLANRDCDTLEEENKQLKSTIAKLIEENRKNNDLLLSDIKILEKALWCSGCENDYGRLKELRKEFMGSCVNEYI